MTIQTANRNPVWKAKILPYIKRSRQSIPLMMEGRLTRMVGLTLEAVGCNAVVGGRCLIEGSIGESIEAEVVGFSGETLYLMPTGNIYGLASDSRVIPTGGVCEAHVGEALLGRVIDGAGNPLDNKGPLDVHETTPLMGVLQNPLIRKPITEPLDVGVRAINSMLTVGNGQRIGLFAGSGVGKSVLLGMMTRFTTADVIVVGLIGERGREVNDFINNILGEEGIKRAVVVACPADNPPLMRLHGCMLSTAIAEYFRDKGLNVLLLIDSLTRFAMAQREIGLAINEPPTTKGYTPSVFSKLPHLVERAGTGPVGSITAFYTVLVEGDDQNDPIADAARAILDGHIVLSRKIADSGRYPAIDVEQSISRLMTDITTPEHQLAARRFKQVYSAFEQNRDLISVGAYQRGSDPQIDQSIQMYPQLNEFLSQNLNEAVHYQDSVNQLMGMMAGA